MYLQFQCLVAFITIKEVVYTCFYRRFLFPEVTINNMSAIHPRCNSWPPKTHCCMKLIITSITVLHRRKFILILPSVDFSCTQADELLKEKAWDEVNKRGIESCPWMGLYVRRLTTIQKMLKSCLKSKEMFLLLCATDENHTKATNLICSNSRMNL